ncbi:MAG: serine/threonine-protein kinase [Blastocatellia bacterium]|nr:serine/threonine-protein kinase [Blastocatellia bacterium]
MAPSTIDDLTTTMTPERYQRICQLFDEALEVAPEQRAAWLDEACGADSELRAEVEKFLAGMEPAADYLARPAMDVAAEMLAQQQKHPSALGLQISHYQIISLLGAGGMGRVYLARDTRLGRQVALKLLPTQYTQDAERVRRFQIEAKAASALNHPNILTIHDVGEAATDRSVTQFIATEYVEGQTLRELLQAGAVAPDQVLDIALQLADALSAAHEAGIVHRDIKPENIMLRPDGYVKVLDFGLAKLTETRKSERGKRNEEENNSSEIHRLSFRDHHSTMPGRVMGTISYMSPEQALGQPLDARTDIFSLGVVLYELLTGVQPFRGNSDAATYNAILNLKPPALTKTIDTLPLEFAAIIERALEKEPSARYQTAAELRAALKQLRQDSTSQERAVAVRRPIASYRRWAALGAVVLLLVGAGYFWQARRAPILSDASPAPLPALPANVSFTQQTEQSGVEYFPTLAPDGKTLVYASRAAGNWDLWLQTIGQRERVNLTTETKADDTQPCFSSDGKQLAFRSEREGGGLFVMELASLKVRKINSEGFNPTWSADGAEIAYGTASITQIEARPNSQLWVVRVDTGEKRLVTQQDAAQPAWSPTGERIAFYGLQANGNLDLMTIPARGGTPVKITSDAPTDWNPCWSADSRYLYFTSDRSGNMSLWRVAIDEATGQARGAPEPATTPTTDTAHLSFSRDGKHLAYVQRNKRRSVQALGFDPVSGTVRGTPVALTRGTGSATHPDISPDGQWLAYSSAGSPQPDIYVMRLDGSEVRQLTNDIYKDHIPRWSPDGKRIAFFSDREGKNEIWTVAPDGKSAPQQLTFAGTGRAVLEDWSPDGNFLVYTMLRQGLYLLDLRKPWEQQTPQPLLLGGRLDTTLSAGRWSPDGKKIVCMQYGADSQHPTTVVYWLPTPDAEARLETIAADTEYAAWLSDSQRMIVITAGKLCVVDIRTKTSRPLLAFGDNEIAEYTSIARDNRTIYFSLASLEADIWLASWTTPK